MSTKNPMPAGRADDSTAHLINDRPSVVPTQFDFLACAFTESSAYVRRSEYTVLADDGEYDDYDPRWDMTDEERHGEQPRESDEAQLRRDDDRERARDMNALRYYL